MPETEKHKLKTACCKRKLILRYVAKAQVTKEKTDHLDLIEIKNFFASKDTIKKVRRQPREWEKIFTNHMCYKGLVSKTY